MIKISTIQSQNLGPNAYYEIPNSCFHGYIRNPNDTSSKIYIEGAGNGSYTETIPAYSVIHFTKLEYNRIYNQSSNTIYIVYVSDPSTTITFYNSALKIESANQLDANIVNSSLDIGTVQSLTEIVNGVKLQQTNNSNNGNSASLTTANTAQPFLTASTTVQHFQVINKSTETIYIGNSSIQAIPLVPNGALLWDATPTETTDLSTWYFVGATVGDKIEFNYQV